MTPVESRDVFQETNYSPASYLDEGPEDDMRYKFTYSTAATVTSHLYITHQLVNFTYISSPCLFALC